MSRIEMKKMLREVVQQAMGKMAKVGAENWSAEDRVIWIVSTALLRMCQGVCTTQAQAALNVLGLKEFHCTKDGKKIVTLFSPPFVDYVKNEGKFKTAEMVADYIYRGEELEKYSPWQMAVEQWKKVKRDMSGLNDSNKVVLFQMDHPQHDSHCLVRKAKADRGQLYHKVIVNVIRRQQFVLNKELRELWLLSLATSWRSHKDFVGKSWEDECSTNKGKMSVKAMSGLLENEPSLMKQKQQKKKENKVVDMVQEAAASGKSLRKQSEYKYSTMVEGENQDNDESPALVIGGENGANSVTAAQLAGMIPVTEESECGWGVASVQRRVLEPEAAKAATRRGGGRARDA
jgi:hypothetical protein